jgi:hypothetical protein
MTWPQAPDAAKQPSPEYLMGKAHMEAIPPCNTPWPEAPHRFEQVLSMGACPETLKSYHVVEADDVTCILCFQKLGGAILRRPIRETIPAPTPQLAPAVVPDSRRSEEPWSL